MDVDADVKNPVADVLLLVDADETVWLVLRDVDRLVDADVVPAPPASGTIP